MKTMTEDEWFDYFMPIPNTVPGGTNGECGLTVDNIGYMFETYGPDLEFVREQPDEFIWTLLEVEGEGILAQGYHIVDRQGYFITEVPADTTIEYSIQFYKYEDNNYEDSMDGDNGSALASAGHGTDEDYSHETI